MTESCHSGRVTTSRTDLLAMTEPPPRSEYLKTLDALSRMRDQCQGELALPQICVVGDQTSGKSSLLQCVTGVPFPVKSGICTRAPCVVQCRNAESELCEIRGSPDAAFEEIRSDDVKTAIGKTKEAANRELGGCNLGGCLEGSDSTLRSENRRGLASPLLLCQKY